MSLIDFIVKYLPALGGASFLGFLGLLAKQVLASGDNRLADKRIDKEALRLQEQRAQERGRMYETAFRHAESYARNLVSIVAPVVLSVKRGERDTALEVIEVACDFLIEPDGDGFKIKPFPNFVRSAREELNDVSGGVNQEQK